MKKIVEAVKEKKWIQYILIIIIGLLVSIPLLWVQLRETDDGYVHMLRIISVGLSFENGSFPYLLTPFFCKNFGYTMTVFYGWLVTYIPYIFYVLVGSASAGIKIFSALTICASGIFMYNFIYEVTKNKGMSFLAGILYMVFPYHLECYYNRFAMGEFTAMIFIPLVLQGVYNLLHGDKKKHFYITIGAVGLILSHTITTIYTALFCLFFVLLNYKAFFKKDVIIKCIINVVFILLIAAFVLIPMLEFETAAHYVIFDADSMRTNGDNVSGEAIDIWEFIKYDEDSHTGVIYVLGVPTLAMVLVSILAYRYIDKKYKDFYIICLFLGILALFMCTKYFPWLIMPQLLSNIQYPWRLIGMALFFLIPVMVMNVHYLLKLIKNEKIRDIVYVAIIIIIGICTVLDLRRYDCDNFTENIDISYEDFIEENPIISHWNVNRDYMTYNAISYQDTYFEDREDTVYVLEGSAIIENEEKYALDLSFDIKEGEEGTILELPYMFYPGYKVVLEVNGELIELEVTESQYGFAQITLPEYIEEGNITVSYTGTTLEKLGYVISGVAFIGFIVYIVWQKRKTKYNRGI